MNRSLKSLLLIGSFITMISCGPSTRLTKTWTDPSVNSSTFKPFTKVLVIALLKDDTGSRIAEDKLVSQFKPGVAIASYKYLQPGDTVQSAVDQKMKADGFDGLLLLRLMDVQESMNVQSSGYPGYYGYGPYYGGRYGYGYGGYGTTTVSVDRDYVVETRIYSLTEAKLLWSGTTSTLNPTSLEQAMDEIIYANKQQLIKQGLIKQ